MKNFLTKTQYEILNYSESKLKLEHVMEKGKRKVFKTKKAAINYCKKNDTIFVEHKHIFYR